MSNYPEGGGLGIRSDSGRARMPLTTSLFVALVTLGVTLGSLPAATAGTFTCTRVLGASHTRQWFLDAPEFEIAVGSDTWELVYRKGSALRWQNPDYIGWSDPPLSPCAERSGDPDRVLLNVSSSGVHEDVSYWVENIQRTLATIRSKYPNLRQILLQPIWGGPNNQVCTLERDPSVLIRASVNHPYIDQAVVQVDAADTVGDVEVGILPHLVTCLDYSNDKGSGHVDRGRRGFYGQMIGDFYVAFDGS